MKAIKDNIDEATQLSEVRPYRRPLKLRKRSELDETASRTVYTANTEATGVVQHKDSIWYQSWQNFKENNTYVNSECLFCSYVYIQHFNSNFKSLIDQLCAVVA